MHPYHSGEIARLHIEQLHREASTSRTPSSTFAPAGFLSGATLRAGDRLRSGGRQARLTLGLTLVRLGTRIADPDRILRRARS